MSKPGPTSQPKPAADNRERDSIEVYASELESQLHLPWLVRKRIVREVKEHLLDSVEQLELGAALPHTEATREAITRFGTSNQVASQFYALRRRYTRGLHRIAILWVAWIAAMAMGSATVWAAVDWPAGLQASRSTLATQSVGGRVSSQRRGFDNATPPRGRALVASPFGDELRCHPSKQGIR